MCGILSEGVVSPVVAPPTLMGANGPKKLPEQRSTEQGHEFPQDIIDKATVPISALRASVMRILDKE